jgi:hypothetical protein
LGDDDSRLRGPWLHGLSAKAHRRRIRSDLIQKPPAGGFFIGEVMPAAADNRSELRRLQLALAALLEDLDAIERRPHFYFPLRHAGGALADGPSDRLDNFVDHFALAMKRSSSSFDRS